MGKHEKPGGCFRRADRGDVAGGAGRPNAWRLIPCILSILSVSFLPTLVTCRAGQTLLKLWILSKPVPGRWKLLWTLGNLGLESKYFHRGQPLPRSSDRAEGEGW